MRKVTGKRAAVVSTAAIMIFSLAGSSKASEKTGETEIGNRTTTHVLASAQRYSLHLHHLHTGEDLDVVYRIGDTYLP